MSANSSQSENARKNKRIVGIVAIAFLLLFTILAFLGKIAFLDWIILDLIVALIANLIFRRLNRQSL